VTRTVSGASCAAWARPASRTPAAALADRKRKPFRLAEKGTLSVKRFLTLVAVVGACVGLFYLVGVILPRTQSRVSRVHMLAKPDAVYRVVSDVATWPTWVPGVMSAHENGSRKDHPLWSIADNEGHTYELEVVMANDPMAFLVNYKLGDTNHTLRFDMKWYGDGSLVLVGHQREVPDRWARARHFFLVDSGSIALPTLLALTSKMGESAKPEEK